MNTHPLVTVFGILVFIGAAVFAVLFFLSRDQFVLPKGETVSLEEHQEINAGDNAVESPVSSQGIDDSEQIQGNEEISHARTFARPVLVTDGVTHSIPLDEILSGGPPKDGIPSIDDPKFVLAGQADVWLSDDDIGLGIAIDGVSRFYPYDILVWHEIVNDVVNGRPLAVTYCPLCRTGVVYDRRVSGETLAFGVSGMLWQSNLLMYDRQTSESNESLWSQVLGEAVLGPRTGTKLAIIRSDTVRYGDWKKSNPNTEVLSRDTGVIRTYGVDPYGDYYTNENVSFGATFTDDRLHPKEFVLGVEVDGMFKAYPLESLPVGTTADVVEGKTVAIEKTEAHQVEMFIGTDREPLPYIGGFWFSWIAVHPETELWDG